MSQHCLNQGASQSLIIQELVQLVRSMLQGSDGPDSQNETQAEFVKLFNSTTQQLASRSWDLEFSDEERFFIIGMFYIFAGW